MKEVIMLQDNDYIIKRCFTRYLIPSIVSIIGGNISILIDNLIAGRVIGDTALATMSLVSPIFFMITTLGILINSGASTIASLEIGKKDETIVNQCFSWAVLLTILTSILLSIIGILFLNPIANFLCHDPLLRDMFREYCLALIPGALCIMSVYIPLNFLRIEGRGKIGMVMFFIMSVLDILFDYLFTAVFRWGMFGLGLATVISSAVSVLICFPLLLMRGGTYCFTAIRDFKLFLRIIVTGSPLALSNFYSVIRMLVFNAVLFTTGGPNAVAAFAFANSVNVVAEAIISGISQTVSPLVGVLYGEKDIKSVKKVILYSCRIGLIFIGVYIICITISANTLCNLFGLTEPVQKEAAMALILCAISYAPYAISSIFIYYFVTVEKTKIANTIAFVGGVFISISLVYLFANLAGTRGIWISFIVSEIFTLGAISLLTFYERKSEMKKKGILLESVLLINMEEIKKEKTLSFAVPNQKNAVIENSYRVAEFCENSNMSPKESMIVSLSIEEILLLMVEHAYKKEDEKEHYMDVHIVYGKEIIMRFRCDGRPFNPLCYYQKELENSEYMDCGESLGINMLLKIVKKIDYTTALGVNNVIVVI